MRLEVKKRKALVTWAGASSSLLIPALVTAVTPRVMAPNHAT